MHLQILKKDLKRKKTMNVILLIFVILSAMFVSSSVNNILTVTTALDSYFEKAGMTDYFIATREFEGATPTNELLDGIESIEDYKTENIIYGNPENFFYNGEQLPDNKNTTIVMPFEDAAINYFDENDNIINDMEDGTVIVTSKLLKSNNLEVGDIVTIEIEGISQDFKIAKGCKDAFLGSNLMGMSRFIITENDYRKFAENEAIQNNFSGKLCYITTSDIQAVEQAAADINSIIFMSDKAMIKMSYVMDMIIAAIILILSLCLIIIAFVVLRFTIAFTLSEEYHEIGVMKAIGIKNFKIRCIYLIKYFSLSIVGAFIGFLLSVPFADMLLSSVSDSMVLENENSFAVNILCSITVVMVILLFCFGCTRKVKKFTPVDAIRSGTTGERFKKKGILRLSKSPLKPFAFMAFNDVLSSPKRYGIITLALTVSLSLILVLSNTINTLRSNELITSFGMAYCDVCYTNNDKTMDCFNSEGKEKAQSEIEEMEKLLAAKGMPSDCWIEVLFKMNISFKDKNIRSISSYGVNSTADMYEYFEGTAPQNKNEVAITDMNSEKLGATIGDTIKIGVDGNEQEYIVTALYHSMNNMGEGVRFHQDVDIDFKYASGFFAYQIKFTDNPNDAEIKERIETIKEIYNTDNVGTAGDYVEEMTAVAGTLSSVRILTISLMIIIIALVTVLIERSFITKEKGEIAILKAMGFTNSSVVKWHTLRFIITGIASVIVSIALTIPLTELTITPIFNMMGATYGISYEIKPLEVFVIYPLAVLAVTVISAFFTSLYTGKIKASEASSIE